jgi:oxygen-dependent protoporphyrinogen oxidase
VTQLVVVGGGISGLAAAWFGADAGHEVTVLEAAPQVGGKLRLAEVGGVSIDVGAEAMLTARPEGVDLISAAGLDGERIEPTTTAAQVRAGGANHPLPARTVFGIPASVEAVKESGVLSDAGLAALAAEPGMEPLPPLADDVSVGRLVRERMGEEVLNRLVEPLLGGVYAGRADDLSLRATMAALAKRLEAGGSLTAAAHAAADAGGRVPPSGPIFTTLRGGLGRLPAALVAARRFEVRTGVTVRDIARTPTGFALECAEGARRQRVEADLVVVAAPAAKAGRLLRSLAPSAAAQLSAIESASMAVVSFAFHDVPLPAGSGLLVGSGERLATKAITLSSQKWPLDADGRTMLRASVGRIGETTALQLEDAELIALVLRELRPLIGVDAQPVDARVTRWGGGLPQYAVGHLERIARIRAAVAAVPGLAVCGAAYDGVGVPACVGSARAAVDRLTASLRVRGQ